MKSFEISLRNYTWIKVGGKATLLKFETIDLLAQFISKNNFFYVIGAGSNSLFINKNKLEIPIIKLGRNFNYIKLKNKSDLIIGASTLSSTITAFATNNNISGFEFLAFIPGTIGGILSMNAGAYNSEIKDIFISAKIITSNGTIIVIKKDELLFSYRACILPKNSIIIEVTIKGQKVLDNTLIKKKINEYHIHRKNSQPINELTCGSFFKNPIHQIHNKAWKLINDSGCKNMRYGDISLSNIHSNFFINHGNATQDDTKILYTTIQQRVFDKYGIYLEPEVKIIEESR